MAPRVCLSCSLPGWQCCALLQGAGVVCKDSGTQSLGTRFLGPLPVACATGTCWPSLAVGAQPRACGQGIVPTLMLGKVPTSLLMGPHQKPVRLRVEKKHSGFFKRNKQTKKQTNNLGWDFFLFVGVSLFLLNHEMTHF